MALRVGQPTRSIDDFPSPQTTQEKAREEAVEEWRQFVERLGSGGGPLSQNTSKIVNRRLKILARKGMPSHLRGKIWCGLGGIEEKVRESNRYYAKLQREKSFLETVVPATIKQQLDLDVPRTFSTHWRFQSPDALRALRRVLLAFAYYNPLVGYCQGLGYLCGALLIHMDEEHAFWALVTLVQDILPPDYYTSTMTGFHADQAVFHEIIKDRLPSLSAHFNDIGMTTMHFSSSWFLCLFLRVLPFDVGMRVWDLVWLYGSRGHAKIIFNVGLALLTHYSDALLAVDNVPEAAQILSSADIPADDLIILATTSCKIPTALLERERLKFRTAVRPPSAQSQLVPPPPPPSGRGLSSASSSAASTPGRNTGHRISNNSNSNSSNNTSSSNRENNQNNDPEGGGGGSSVGSSTPSASTPGRNINNNNRPNSRSYTDSSSSLSSSFPSSSSFGMNRTNNSNNNNNNNNNQTKSFSTRFNKWLQSSDNGF